ncbi:MAG: polymerase sigma factor FliA [Acidimicrobiia bacterium]|jgi:RNA polymerase sigma factor for flagellar operon FliA|nr:polymerase sigma factor FliA [Acidimicrobiia bacterium]
MKTRQRQVGLTMWPDGEMADHQKWRGGVTLRQSSTNVTQGTDLAVTYSANAPSGSHGPNGRSRGSRDELTQRIEQHLPLVRHIVFQVAVHFPRHVDREDLARAGALGLVEAARRYDEARGVPFDRFAAQRIRGAILDAVRAADWAPRSVRNLARRLEQAEQRLATELGRVPSLQEMADALEVRQEELIQLQNRMFRSVVLALEHEVTEEADEELTLVDVLRDRSTPEPPEELELRELRAYLRDAVHLLPERHRLVIVGYFMEDRSSLELARFLGVTESRISQLRSEALIMLREGIEAQYKADDPELSDPRGRVARRKAGYALAIRDASGWRSRLDDLQRPSLTAVG